MRKRLFNKLGMTYIELLVALALLSLIIVSFTPMLMSSYENLYKAGERVEIVYKSQEEMEEGLATRYSIRSSNISMSFTMNAQTVLENLNVNGRKVVSSLQDRLETIFYGVRARIDIISGDTVYDDTLTHDIILQTTGLEYTKVTLGNYAGDINQLPQNQIHIKAFIPDKVTGASNGSTTDELAYGGKAATLSLISANSRQGRIAFTVGGADFTQSPIKFIVYYKNERGILKQLPAYLYIEPATMLIAGDQNNFDYYTSAGVETKDNSTDSENQRVKYVLNVQGRTMNVANSGLLTDNDRPTKVGAKINTIAWVPNDENPKLNPYYVMAGDNGVVYRMYNYATLTNLQGALGSSNSVADTSDNALDLVTGVRVYQSFWSGEMSDHYSFQTLKTSSTYGKQEDNSIDCSAPNTIEGHSVVGTQYNKIDKNLRYSYHFSAYRTGYQYASQASRRISYVLTEAGNKSFRIAAKKQEKGDFTGYNAIWEPEYITFDKSGLTYNTEDSRAVYCYKTVVHGNCHTDMHLAPLRLPAITTIDPIEVLKNTDTTTYETGETMYNRFITSGDFWSPPGKSEESLRGIGWNDRVNYVNTKYGCSASIKSVAYLPGSGSNGQGQVIYFGTVPAYANLRQCSDTDSATTKMYNNDKQGKSAVTAYVICGSQTGGSTIYRLSYTGAGNNKNRTEGVDAQDWMRTQIANNNVKPEKSEVTFYTRKGDNQTYMLNSDVKFTLGYCSRWRMTVGDVTFNGTTEETRSYEKYYKKTHPSANYQRQPGINKGNEDNLYYNVWFPGEFYNLVDTATCDAITIAGGYTVAGSAFMSESWIVKDGYYGTALGDVYNDAVLSAYINDSSKAITAGLSGKGERNMIFQNLLYFKSPAFEDPTTHARASYRIEKVGLNSKTDDKGNKEYWAYYAINGGAVFKSKVATSTVTTSGSGEDITTKETVTLRQLNDTTDIQEVTINGYSVSQVFSEVVSIEAEEDIVIISGKAKNDTTPLTVLIGVKGEDGNISDWKGVKFGDKTGMYVTGTTIVGGYYYFTATNAAGSEGYVGAVNLELLKRVPKGTALPIYKNESEVDNGVIYTEISDIPYAIAGRETV